jgi:hypothetical protein
MLVCPALAELGIAVRHILADGGIITQEELEDRLLRAHAPSWQQASLFEKSKTRAEALAEAYDRRNRAIGYSLPDDAPPAS